VIGLLVDAFERVPSPMTGMVIEHFNGAVTRIDPTATAYPHRDPGYNLVLTGEWLDPADDDANIAWVRSTFEAVAPYTAEAVYVNYLAADEPERVRRIWTKLGAARRAEADVDPDNVFHLNQNIDPAG
jgi:berberine-like enzyme